MIELKRLRYFYAVAELENVRSAAERLHMSQPPLTQQIKRLEDELGVTLFDRVKGRIRLTPAGEQLRDASRDIFRAAERAFHDARRAAKGEIGRLRIGLTDDYVYGGLPRLIADFQTRYPDIKVESEVSTTAILSRQVYEGEVDLAFVCPPLPIEFADLTVRPVSSSYLRLMVPASHELAKRSVISLGEVADESFILPRLDEKTGFFLQLMKMFESAGFLPRIRHETYSVDFIAGLVAEGFGISIVSENSVSSFSTAVTTVAIDNEHAALSQALVWSPDSRKTALKSFLEMAAA